MLHLPVPECLRGELPAQGGRDVLDVPKAAQPRSGGKRCGRVRVVALDVFESEIRDHRRGERQVVFDEQRTELHAGHR